MTFGPTKRVYIDEFKDKHQIGATASSVRDGVSRKALDAIAKLTRTIDEDSVPLEVGFALMTILVECVLPYVNPDTSTTINDVYGRWINLVEDEREQKRAILESQERFKDYGKQDVSENETVF